LRAARALAGWSARELAERAGVDITTVQRMERRNGPVGGRAETVDNILRAFDVAGVEVFAENGRIGVALTMDPSKPD
jgi:transcriptional regulator with XRE-family HTH domain